MTRAKAIIEFLSTPQPLYLLYTSATAYKYPLRCYKACQIIRALYAAGLINFTVQWTSPCAHEHSGEHEGWYELHYTSWKLERGIVWERYVPAAASFEQFVNELVDIHYEISVFESSLIDTRDRELSDNKSK